MYRQRIRVTLTGEHAFDPPVELHDQQLQYPEYRFLDCVEGHHKTNSPKVPKLEPKIKHELPVRALNEVFIGESLSSRVSYYELALDSAPKEKLKSSGLTVCTGTGSTSWSFNINKVTEQCVKHLLKITSQETKLDIPVSDSKLISQITSRFNNSLIFDPTKELMAYTIRDPIVFGMGFKCKPRGFVKRIEVKSRMFDACLVIDGGLSFAFNDGSTALLDINEDDALRTLTLPD
ncbi:NAD kinase 2, mitochondrial-like [Stegodyphus dumicola]|uniref:NAD kinase 2, mitochondrial-like n=1 Tax=Stegodyphus dumicola TaxID=202533 RepID=UPI0015AC6386|nr:NAD kinase 2, mitochondrial-like [Stegodyphus dumicola]